MARIALSLRNNKQVVGMADIRVIGSCQVDSGGRLTKYARQDRVEKWVRYQQTEPALANTIGIQQSWSIAA
jgi:hypothetical protein